MRSACRQACRARARAPDAAQLPCPMLAGYFRQSSTSSWQGALASPSLEHFPPDMGPMLVPPMAGVATIGAVPWLVNYNVPVDTQDLAAGQLASRRPRVRAQKGLPLGFSACTALQCTASKCSRVVHSGAAAAGVGMLGRAAHWHAWAVRARACVGIGTCVGTCVGVGVGTCVVRGWVGGCEPGPGGFALRRSTAGMAYMLLPPPPALCCRPMLHAVRQLAAAVSERGGGLPAVQVCLWVGVWGGGQV